MMNSRLVLVDHHESDIELPWVNIIQLFDHRPVNRRRLFVPNDCPVTVEQVGSCATLITKAIKDNGLLDKFPEILPLLRAPIVLDTVNFSEAAGKTHPLDIEMNDDIERLLQLDTTSRLELFNELVAARNSVDTLSTLQILSKDLKIITYQSIEKYPRSIAIPGFPILAEVRGHRIYSILGKNLRHKFNCHPIFIVNLGV